MESQPQKRRPRFNGKKMHRLQVLIPEDTYQEMLTFAPDRGAGFVVEEMVKVISAKRSRRVERSAGEHRRAA